MEHHIKSYSPCEKVHAAFEIKFQSFLYQKCKSFSVSHVFVQLEALYDIQILYIPPLLDRCLAVSLPAKYFLSQPSFG